MSVLSVVVLSRQGRMLLSRQFRPDSDALRLKARTFVQPRKSSVQTIEPAGGALSVEVQLAISVIVLSKY
jgi:hypothetical protein